MFHIADFRYHLSGQNLFHKDFKVSIHHFGVKLKLFDHNFDTQKSCTEVCSSIENTLFVVLQIFLTRAKH